MVWRIGGDSAPFGLIVDGSMVVEEGVEEEEEAEEIWGDSKEEAAHRRVCLFGNSLVPEPTKQIDVTFSTFLRALMLHSGSDCS